MKTHGNWRPYRLVSANTTNATSVKAAPGGIGFIVAINNNTDERFLKVYNKASAPTVGTDTPALTFMIPGNTSGAGFVLPIPEGLFMSVGIAFALTTGVADSDTGAVAANEITLNMGYS